MNNLLTTTVAVVVAGLCSTGAMAGDFTANASVSNNYLWRGLTQTQNEPAVSGGIDYGHESGLYVGTWVSNVEYGDSDSYSYENDIYVGYAGEYEGIGYDIGYLYYNYDEDNDIDFGEVYGSLSYMNFSVTAWLFAHTEANESIGVGATGSDYDFDFGSAYYLEGNYAYEIKEGLELGLHVGYHNGDFVDAFNFADGTDDYVDWNVSISKAGFGFVVSGTDLDDSPSGLQNDQIKYVVSYSFDIDL
jgi:uncharacterized protein (TIGR02001 family)